MKKPQTVAADGVLKNALQYSNLQVRPYKNKSAAEVTRRDANVLKTLYEDCQRRGGAGLSTLYRVIMAISHHQGEGYAGK